MGSQRVGHYWVSFTFTFMLHFFFLITKSLLSEQHFVFRERENNNFLNISCFKSCYLMCKQQYRQTRIRYKCWDLSIVIVVIVLIQELSETYFFFLIKTFWGSVLGSQQNWGVPRISINPHSLASSTVSSHLQRNTPVRFDEPIVIHDNHPKFTET